MFRKIMSKYTIDYVKKMSLEYYNMTAPFSFDLERNGHTYRLHVFLTCGSYMWSLMRRTHINLHHPKEDKFAFPFSCYVFAEQNLKTRSKNAFKAPFEVGFYCCEYDLIFNENGHIHNNEDMKNTFIKALSDKIIINDEKKSLFTIAGNNFSSFLTKDKKTTKENIIESIYQNSFHTSLNKGFNIFFYTFTRFKESQKINSNVYRSHYSYKKIEEKFKSLTFYDSLNDLLHYDREIFTLESYIISDDDQPCFSAWKTQNDKVVRHYQTEQCKYIKTVVRYLQKLDIDWNVIAIITDTQKDGSYEYEEKYHLFTTSKKVKLETGKRIFPRIDFMNTYPLIAQTNSMEQLKAVMEHVDELKPLKTVELYLMDRKLTPKERKFIVGKEFYRTYDKDILPLYKKIFSSLEFENCLALQKDRYEMSHAAIQIDRFYRDVRKFLNLESLDEFVNSVPKNMNIEHFFFYYARFIYRNSRHNRSDEEFYHAFDPKGELESLILETIDDTYKQISLRNVSDCTMSDNFTYNYESEKYVDFTYHLIRVSVKLEYMLKEKYKEDTDKIYSEIENLRYKIKAAKTYFKKQYYPVLEKKHVKNQLKNISDTFFLFEERVLLPICAYLSKQYEAYDDSDKNSDEARALRNHNFFNLFTYGSKDLLSLMRMSHDVHRHGNIFNGAGMNPASLQSLDETKLSTYLETENSASKDRVAFDLSQTHEWVAGTRFIAHITYENIEYAIIPLINSDELTDEGNAMRHCVGWAGYSEMSLEGKRKIFSIRQKVNGVFERLTTLELAYNVHDKTVRVIQNQTRGNHSSSESNRIVSIFVDEINAHKHNKDNVMVSWDDIVCEQKTAKEREHDPERTRMIAQKAGYMPNSVQAIKAALKPWLPYLDKKYHEIEHYAELEFVKECIKQLKTT